VAHRKESVKDTRHKLELAVRRLVDGNPIVVPKGSKLTAASVSKEAGVDRVTLYRFHEPVLTEIRKINDTTPRALLKENRSELHKTATQLGELRRLVEEAQEKVAALARENYRQDARNAELEGLLRIRDETIAEYQKALNSRSGDRKHD
jgi:serine phosphatase RsbU (regulator of sigma subunit)